MGAQRRKEISEMYLGDFMMEDPKISFSYKDEGMLQSCKKSERP